jgi:hypothetical protein
MRRPVSGRKPPTPDRRKYYQRPFTGKRNNRNSERDYLRFLAYREIRLRCSAIARKISTASRTGTKDQPVEFSGHKYERP